MTKFPRTEVAGISLPRMLIGTNWILGYSHTGAAADALIHERNDAAESVRDIVNAYLEYDIDAMPSRFTMRMIGSRTEVRVFFAITPLLHSCLS